MSEPRKTPLAEEHVKLGARMVDFAGWYMPVQYKGIIEEHKAVRSGVGLFDVSHMGEVWFRGSRALESLQWLTSNDVSKLGAGQAQYSLLTNDSGGVVDDIIVYCAKPNSEYLVCVNAANITKDYQWMVSHNRGAEVTNESDKWGQIAIQGPKAMELASRIFGKEVASLKGFHWGMFPYSGTNVWVARTGYTGEDGVEVFVPKEQTVSLWQNLLSKGADLGVQPIGLGARDTLRLEMKYPLYGHELNDETNPLEARLGWVVKLDKGDFIGKGPIEAMKKAGTKRELVGFKMSEKGIPRDGYPLISFDKNRIGYVTSGTMSPSLSEGVGVGYVEKAFASEGSEFFVEIRGKTLKVKVVKTPFVSPKKG